MKLDIEKLKGLAEAALDGSKGLIPRASAVAEFSTHTGPAAVLELIAEIKRLKSVEDYLELEMSGEERAKLMLAEKLGCADEPRWKWMPISADDLNAENESLRKDAERYRWLCAGNGYFMEESGLCGHSDEKAQADAEIDAAMLQGQP